MAAGAPTIFRAGAVMAATCPAEARATALQLDGQDCVLIQIRDLRPEILAEVGRSVRKLAHDLRNALTTSQLLADRLAGSDDAACARPRT